jgi:proprotein convertase subtilisin/kexin type 5
LACAQFCTSCIASTCKACLTGYYVNGIQCIKCSSVLPNCQLCATGTACSTCPQGYYSSGNSLGCMMCSQSMTGCSTCAVSSKCSTCQAGYYLNGTTCKTCVFSVNTCCQYFISNCTICRNVTLCGQCAGGFYLSINSQSCIACANTLLNCLSCSTASACLLCETTFFLNTYSQCVPCSSSIAQCSTCANSSSCLFCQLPFLMVNGTCLDCPIWPMNNLYYLDASNVCQPCSTITPSCTKCNGQTCT